MKILLFGKNGQVGRELQRALAPLGEVVALDRHGQDGLCGDLSDPDGLRQTVATLKPQLIVNTAAYTAVDKAESEPELAQRINARAPGLLAEAASELGALLVDYSTDYIFDGNGERPWREDDPAAPVNIYGHTKWQGEEAIRAANPHHLILRTQWVYAARGKNFLATMLRLASERDRLQVVDDQIGAPTSAGLIADVSVHAIRGVIRRADLAGVYHLTASGETSWHGYARYAIQTARELGWPIRVEDEAIEAVPSSAFPTPARRPQNSRLALDRIEQAFELQMPDWRAGVERAVNEMCGSGVPAANKIKYERLHENKTGNE